MENNEIREKLLCVLRNHIQDFKKYGYDSFLLSLKSIDNIWARRISVDKDASFEKEVIYKPKYFWQKPKVKMEIFSKYTLDYYTLKISYGDYTTRLTKEEYEELMQIREEKIKEKQLEELTKLCNNN